jgi:CMP-N,N'-diacetyllegionaminic acid synthase
MQDIDSEIAETLIVIPARGGSKRLPGKNLKELDGKSLISRVAGAIVESGLKARAVLTTDNTLIAAEGRRVGLEVPFLRPAAISTDTSATVDVVLHALDWFKEANGADPRTVIVLQPTSPFRGGLCIRDGLNLMHHWPDAGSVVAMSALHVSSTYVFQVDDSGIARPISDAQVPALVPNGALYITRVSRLRAERTLYASPVIPLLLDRRQAIDIDTQDDWDIAEALIACRHTASCFPSEAEHCRIDDESPIR